MTGRRLHVLFLTHYYPPEVGAPQARLSELARRLAANGVLVTVVTGFPNYPIGVIAEGYRDRLLMKEEKDGVTVIRTWVFATPNRGFTKRLVNHASFALSSLLAIPRLGKVDVIFIESPPLAIGVAALAYSLLKRAPYIFNVSDIWPQSAIEMGALTNRTAIAIAEAFERALYRRARIVTVVTPGILDKLAARGIPRDKLFLLTNAVDTDVFRPSKPDDALAERLGITGRKVFLYAGTHGMAQGLDVVLDAARQTKDCEVLYVLAGEGAEKDRLVARARADGIDKVRFLGNQPRDVMPRLLNLAYATVIPLRRLDVFAAALPSKMFEAMASEKPIVLAVHGEAAELVERARCGIVVPPEDPAAMTVAVERLAADDRLTKELGANGRRFVLEHFDREKVATGFLEMLQQAAGG